MAALNQSDDRTLPLLPLPPLARPVPTPDDYRRLNYPEAPALDTISHSVLICGDAAQALTLLPDQSIQTVVTSPPY